MRLVEEVKLTGQRLNNPRGFKTLIQADGVAIVTIDEYRLLDMIRKALANGGKRCKAGPVHVRIAAKVTTRPRAEGEVEDHLYSGHEWRTKEIPQ